MNLANNTPPAVAIANDNAPSPKINSDCARQKGVGLSAGTDRESEQDRDDVDHRRPRGAVPVVR